MKKMLLFAIVLIIGTAWGQDCTADDGTEGVELWGQCYSIENTTIVSHLGKVSIKGSS